MSAWYNRAEKSTQYKEVLMHILIIEDERSLCETIVRSLRRLAYSVDFCYDGNKAIELLCVERYDLVLLDLNLPGADGMTVLADAPSRPTRHQGADTFGTQ